MNIKSLSSLLCTFSLIISFNSNAAVVGPDYPPPGGNTWVGNGVSGADGVAIWTYSNFDTNAFSELYFGLNQVDYGALGAGLNGSVDAFSLHSVTGTTAEWRASTQWLNPTTLVLQAAQTRLTMDISGLGVNPWITDLASIGLDDVGMFGDLGVVADNSAGLDFTLNWSVQADTGSGWQSINSVQQHITHDGYTRSSVGTGFYSVSAVPVPAAIWLFGSGLLGLIGVARRKKV